MSKKFTTIEEQITEGFWDAIVNKSKRLGLAAGAALGSNHSKGKLDANTLATELYNNFKLWQGQTGLPADWSAVSKYLIKKVSMDPRFVVKMTGVDSGDSGSNQQTQPQSNAAGSFDDPLKHIGGDAGKATPQASSGNGQQSSYTPEGDDFRPVSQALDRFMKRAQWTQFKNARDATGYDASPQAAYQQAYDGSFIFAKSTKDQELRNLIESAAKDDSTPVAEIITALKQGGYFGTWEQFKEVVGRGVERIAKNSPEEADLFRQSLTQGAAEYHLNFPQKLNRFVIAPPPSQPHKNAAVDWVPLLDGDFDKPGKATSESVVTSKTMLTEADMSDGELRKHFLDIAKHALAGGEIEIAANNALSHLRGDNVVGNGVVKNNGNQQDGQQTSQADQLLSKAQALGKVLGVNINKFTLGDMKKKDAGAYREFMQYLDQEQGASFSQDFLDHARKALTPFFDFKNAKPNPDANNNVAGGTTPQEGGSNTAKAEPTADDPIDEDGLTFYDIDRRQMAWDPKDEMLIVRSTKNGKVNERTYKRTDDGWVNDRDAAVQEKNIKLVDSWYDRVMAKSGGEAAQDNQPATPAKVDPTVIPNGATVTNPKNNGQYKFDGKSWHAGNGAEIPESTTWQRTTRSY
jgi:hypothetical protein